MRKRNRRYLAVIVLIVLLLVLVSGKNISLEYPSSVDYDDPFDIKIGLIDFPESTYDLKIDLTYEGDRVAEIRNPDTDEFRSTYYYVNDVIKNQTELRVKIIENFDGEADIVVKVRDDKSSKSFSGYKIDVDGKEVEKELPVEDKLTPETSEVNSETSLFNDNESEADSSINEGSTNKVEDEIQILSLESPQSIKKISNSEIIYRSSNEKIKQYAIYGFALFCVLIITLLIIERR